MKPIVYTPTNNMPIVAELALDIIINTVDKAGPTHGVHAKLKVNPMNKAVKGFIRNLSKSTGSRNSFPLKG